MENQSAKRAVWRSFLTGQWWRDDLKDSDISEEELLRIVARSPRDRERWLKRLLPGDGRIGLPGGLTSGTIEFSVPMSEEHTKALRTWRDMNVVKNGNSVFLDTTCLETARLLIEDRNKASQYLLPLTLLDLDTFASCAILHDRIYHLQNPHFKSQSLHSLFGEDLFYELPVEDVRTDSNLQPYFGGSGIHIENILEAIYAVAQHWASLLRGSQLPEWRSDSSPWIGSKEARIQVKILKESWKAILGQDLPVAILLGDPNRDLYNWHSPTEKLIDDLLRADHFYKFYGNLRDPDSRQFSFVSEANHRAMFNTILAQNVLEIPYAPSSARWPFRRFLYDASKEWSNVGLDLKNSRSVRILEKYYQEELGKIRRLEESDDLQLPVFLAAILNRVDDVSQIPEEISNWRRQAAPFRQRLGELDEMLNERTRGGKEIDRIMRALRDEPIVPEGLVWANRVRKVLLLTAPVFFFANPLASALASLVLTLPELIDAPTLAKLHRRCFRREYYFLTKIGYAIDELTKASAIEKIQSLWRLGDEDLNDFSSRLHEMRRLQFV